MAGEGKCELQPHKTISDTERSRRQSAVNYARASVGLEGFSLSEADEALRPVSSMVRSACKSLCNRALTR